MIRNVTAVLRDLADCLHLMAARQVCPHCQERHRHLDDHVYIEHAGDEFLHVQRAFEGESRRGHQNDPPRHRPPETSTPDPGRLVPGSTLCPLADDQVGIVPSQLRNGQGELDQGPQERQTRQPHLARHDTQSAQGGRP